jgi:hypothetical protein
MVLSYIYLLPFGKGKHFGSTLRGPANVLLGGWEIAGTSTFKKGVPLSINGNINPGSTFGGNQNVNVIGDPNHVTHKGIDQWFNTDAFEQADAGSFGNAPRFFSRLRAPGINNTDLSIAKWFDVTDSVRTQFRVEMFNALNHPNFAPPNTTFGASGFGTITDASGARNIQLALKIYW